MIGSCMFGQELVEAVRDNVEATLRGIMANAPVNSTAGIPVYTGESSKNK